jgi:predicted TPR repeat methyltransferase
MISPGYLAQLRAVHASREWGASGYSHAAVVADWRRKTGARTVLDFGCGRGTLKPALLKIDPAVEVFEFDPAIPDKDALPQPADLVVANDVLEHIEPGEVATTLSYIRGLAKVSAYFTIALTPSKVSLPDGRNAHLTLLSDTEWLARLRLAGFEIVKAQMRKGLWVWAR